MVYYQLVLLDHIINLETVVSVNLIENTLAHVLLHFLSQSFSKQFSKSN